MKSMLLLFITVLLLNLHAFAADVVCIKSGSENVCAEKWLNPDNSFRLNNPVKTYIVINTENLISASPWFLAATGVNGSDGYSSLYQKSKKNIHNLCVLFGGSGAYSNVTTTRISNWHTYVARNPELEMWTSGTSSAIEAIDCDK